MTSDDNEMTHQKLHTHLEQLHGQIRRPKLAAGYMLVSSVESGVLRTYEHG